MRSPRTKPANGAMDALCSLLNHVDAEGRVPIPVTVRLSPGEWVMVARCAAHEGRTIHDVITGLLTSEYEGTPSVILESLDDYLEAMPAVRKGGKP